MGGSGSYYFVETSSPRVLGDLFTLAYDGSVCTSSSLVVSTVAFSYHMHGVTMGTLRLVDAAGTVVWSLSGDQGDSWRSASAAAFSTSFSLL